MAKNKIGYEKQSKMVAQEIPQPFSFEYSGEVIEVDPVVTPATAVSVTEVVEAIVLSDGTYYPELYEFASRLAIMTACITNMRWDTEKVMERHYNQIMYTGLYGAFVRAMEEHNAADVVYDMRNNTYDKLRYELDMRKQSAADAIATTLLDRVAAWFDRFEDEYDAQDIPKLIQAVKDMKELSAEDKLVPQILGVNKDDTTGGAEPIHKE